MATIKLTNQMFLDNIFDYTTEKEWKYKDNVPAIIDFYADWCGPCKMVAPILEELSDQYEGKLKIYKLDTEVERELAAVFGIPFRMKPLSKRLFRQLPLLESDRLMLCLTAVTLQAQ
ncbi:MAG TPA: hypothetical protein ENK91_08745 [Bacteroidetes bacterium]|nr:hypothetical protein [Bacteroidota bacterium]